MIEIIQHGFGIILLILGAYFCYISNVLVSEKNERRRKGLTDYYDNPIKKEDNE